MKSRFRPNRFDVFALLAVIVTTVLCLHAALNAANAYTSLGTITAWKQVVGCLGWFIATFGPITVSIAFWRWSKRVRKAWLVHLLMFPLAYGLITGGASLMLFAIGDPDFDATIGGPVLQAAVLFDLAVIGYYFAVACKLFGKFLKRSDGS
jgi:hypothetical protein